MELRKKNGGELYMADGGMFGGLKRAMGIGPPETMREKFAREDAKLKARMASSAPAPAPAPPPQKAITQYSSGAATERRMKEAGLKNGGELRTGQGGMVPGKGKGDKIAAKYEPGEFVVSNAMLAKSPGLRQELQALRKEVLADKGMTPEQADAKAMRGPGLRAVNGFEEEEKRKRTAFPSQVPDQSIYRNLGKSNSFGDAASGAQTVVAPKNTAFPSNPPTKSIYASQGNPVTEFSNAVFEATGGSGRPGAQVDAERRASMPVTPFVENPQAVRPTSFGDAASGAQSVIATKPMAPAGLNAVKPDPSQTTRAGQRIISMPFGTSDQEAAMTQLNNTDGVVQVAKDPNAPAGFLTRNDDVEAMRRPQAGTPTNADTSPAPTPAPPAPTPQPAAPPAAAPQPEQINASGIRRIDGGSSPLFTNMPDGGMDGNTALMNRRPMSAQNQRAWDNMQAQQDAGDLARLQKFQYDQEVQQAQAINAAQARSRMSKKQQLGMRKLDIDEANNKSRLGLDVLRTQEDMATGALTREGARMTIDQAKQLSTLQQQYLAAGNNPEKQKDLAAQIAALSGKGKDGGNLKDNFLVVGGGQEWDERAGAMRNVPQSVVDLRTGQPVGGVSAGAPKAQPAPPDGAKLTGPDGKAYVVRNGVPVLEK